MLSIHGLTKLYGGPPPPAVFPAAPLWRAGRASVAGLGGSGRALVHGPRLVLADEPTGNLDPETAGQVLGLLRQQVKANGAAGILVTHSRVAAETCDRTLLLTAQGLREVKP